MSADAVDVVVVGAGLAGLVSARRLERAGLDVRVLEGGSRVGGKTLTAHVGTDHVDLGAHWIGPGQHRVAALATELGVTTRPQPVAGKDVIVVNGRRHTLRGPVPPLDVKTAVDLCFGTLRLWRRYRRAGFDRYSTTSIDTTSGGDLARRVFRTPAARDLFTMFVGLLLGADLHEVSAAHLLSYLRSNGGMRYLSEFKGGAQQDFFVGGSQQICQLIAAQLARPVQLDARVTAVDQDSSGVTVITHDKHQWRAREAVLAISPPLLAHIDFTPALPAAMDHLVHHTRLGAYSKFVAVYERPWWRDEGYSGSGYATDGPLQMVVDGCAESERGILVGFSTASAARRMAELDPGRRRDEALGAMSRLLGAKARQAIDFLEIEWANAAMIDGAPVAFQPPGATPSSTFPLPAFEHVHWAGTDLAVNYNGYLDGAIESAEHAAGAILKNLLSRRTEKT